MSFTSLAFLAFSVVAIVVLRLVPSGWPRALGIFVLNVAFVATFIHEPLQLLPLLAFVVLGYAAILVATRSGTGSGFGLIVGGLILIFAWMKHYSVLAFLPGLSPIFLIVGLSYILFRILHLVIDVAEGSLKVPGFLGYLNYVFFFLTFVSGPIQRYEDFSAQAASRPAPCSWEEANLATGRIVLGYVMLVVVASAASQLVEMIKPLLLTSLAHGVSAAAVGLYIGLIVTYLINLFANFAGYMHIVIGIGGLAGFVLPENFDHPFVAKNFMDLWSRWHITLSNWLKFYLFNPLLKALTARWGSRKRTPYLGVAAFFATFVVMGIWHGTTSVFLVYGLFLGFGISINRLWQVWAAEFLGRNRYRALCESFWYYQLSRAMTLAYFAIALICLWVNDEQIASFASANGLIVAAIAFVVLSVLGTGVGALWDWVAASAVSLLDPRAEGHGEVVQPSRWFGLKIIAAPLALLLGSAVLDVVLLAATHAVAGSSAVRAVATVLIFALILTAVGTAAGMLDKSAALCIARYFKPRRHADATAAWMGLRVLVLINFSVQLASAVPEFIYRAY